MSGVTMSERVAGHVADSLWNPTWACPERAVTGWRTPRLPFSG